ncbi:MDR family MFS transporter [Cellulomonas biazotea]|uniref:MFS transporter n=1 Tax=Cellulomonas biazotea TaxID=1709 RepID=A0A402DPR9_9CELL|nr:MDR family MFS transporter [Cellulomonas biazotea]GCE76142.1 MFS transporter [Cellulomonas biazotea]
MVTTGLVAIDATILATAVPTIVRELGGFESFPWLFSVYLLTQAVSVPIYSKLADTVGRLPVVLVGIGLFLLGSVLCGLAWSMPALIAARAVQGLGAGAVQPMAITIAGDIYTVAERAKAQAYIAAVWAASSVVGPTLGGVFSEYASWRWIFWVNVPLCAWAAWLLVRHLREDVARVVHRIDWAGGALLTVGLTLLVLALLEGGHAWPWASLPSIGSLSLAVVLLVAFVLVERRAAEPVLPLWVFRRRLLVAAVLVALSVGAVLVGLSSYIPTFLEVLLGVTPLVSGLTLAALTLGWPITASQSGRLYLRYGFRATALTGAALVLVGTVALVVVSLRPTVVGVGLCCFVVGAGMGLAASPTLIAAQASVGWGDRGVVTGTNAFARSLGSAVGVALLGALVNGLLRGADATQEPERFQQAVTVALVGVVLAAVALAVGAALIPRSTPTTDRPPDRARPSD